MNVPEEGGGWAKDWRPKGRNVTAHHRQFHPFPPPTVTASLCKIPLSSLVSGVGPSA